MRSLNKLDFFKPTILKLHPAIRGDYRTCNNAKDILFILLLAFDFWNYWCMKNVFAAGGETHVHSGF
jgi:hypothetical protein